MIAGSNDVSRAQCNLGQTKAVRAPAGVPDASATGGPGPKDAKNEGYFFFFAAGFFAAAFFAGAAFLAGAFFAAAIVLFSILDCSVLQRFRTIMRFGSGGKMGQVQGALVGVNEAGLPHVEGRDAPIQRKLSTVAWVCAGALAARRPQAFKAANGGIAAVRTTLGLAVALAALTGST